VRMLLPVFQSSSHVLLVLSLVPQLSRSAALLALTGDDELNRHLRKKAKKSQMLLNEYGLWKWNQRPRCTSSSEDGSELHNPEQGVSPLPGEGVPREEPEASDAGGYWSMVKTSTEREIFEHLGVGFINPHKRSWGFLSGSGKLKPTSKKFSAMLLPP